MKTVTIKVDSAQKASRLELFIRIVWAIPTVIVLWVFGIIAGLCMIIQWIAILITGKRVMGLNDVIAKFLYYHTKVSAYMTMLTDERNPILPEA